MAMQTELQDAAGKPPFAEFDRHQEGQLERERTTGWCSSKWPLEFFVVTSEFLVSYSSQTSREVETCVFLAAVREVVPQPKQRDPFLFVVRYALGLGSTPGDGTGEVVLRAGDEAEMKTWIVAIHTASERRRRNQHFVPLSDARDQVNELQRQEAEHLEALDAAKHLSKDLQKKVDELEARSAEATTALEQATQELQAMRCQCHELEHEVNELRQQLEKSNHVGGTLSIHQEMGTPHQQHKTTADVAVGDGDMSQLAAVYPTDSSEDVDSLRQQFKTTTASLEKLGALNGELVRNLLAASLFNACASHRQKMLSSAWSRFGAYRLHRERLNEGAARLWTQLECHWRRSKSSGFGLWRLQTARCHARHVCIAAGALRVEWVCRRLFQRSFAPCFAALRMARIESAPLQHVATLHHSLELHRQQTSFYLLRLRATVPPPCFNAKYDLETQTEGQRWLECFASIGVQTEKTEPEMNSLPPITSTVNMKPCNSRGSLCPGDGHCLDSSKDCILQSCLVDGISHGCDSTPGSYSASRSEAHESSVATDVSTDDPASNHSEALPHVHVLDASDIENRSGKKGSNLPSVRCGLEGESCAASRASSRIASRPESRAGSATPEPQNGLAELADELQLPVDREVAAHVQVETEKVRFEDLRCLKHEEKQVIEQRWWRALAEVATGSV